MILKNLLFLKNNQLLKRQYVFQKTIWTSYKTSRHLLQINYLSTKCKRKTGDLKLYPFRYFTDSFNHPGTLPRNTEMTDQLCKNVFDLLYQHSLNTNELLSYHDLIKLYSMSPLQLLFDVITNSGGIYEKHVLGPNSFEENDVWKSKMVLLWPETMVFLGSGTTKKNAEFNSALAGIFWLHKFKNVPIESIHQPIDNMDIFNGKWSQEDSPTKMLNNENMYNLFPKPRETLSNIFKSLSEDLNQNEVQLKCKSLRQIDGRGRTYWISAYHLGWPEDLIFSAEGNSKKEASQSAALSALVWLKNNDKITNEPDMNPEETKNTLNGRKTVNKKLFQDLLTKTVEDNEKQISTNETVQEIHYQHFDKSEIETASHLFPFPKDTLHATFKVLSGKLKARHLLLNPTYNKIKFGKRYTGWVSTYFLKWPENIKFVAEGATKKESSHRAALLALIWLKNNSKIDSGFIKQSTRPRINLNFFQNVLSNTLTGVNLQQIRQMSTHQQETRSNKERVPLENAENIENPDIASKEQIFQENEESKSASRLFPQAKNTLHNIFDVVANELNIRTLRVTPQYKLQKVRKQQTSWNCTYNLQWPENIKFTAKGMTKQEASHKAALAALMWLKNNEKINKDGQPMIYSKNEVKHLTLTSLPTLSLNRESLENVEKIDTIIRNKFVKHLAENVEDSAECDEESTNSFVEHDDVAFNSTKRIRFLNENIYLAKEKVKLPIADYKSQFIDALNNNQVVIVKGEPGCGKSTRIPQYVLESWIRAGNADNFCRIAVTQPRRIAAISLAERVAKERDESTGSIVGYQVRFKSNFQPQTGRILYCTTGILLRQLQSDQNLNNFSHIILDEAHERDVNTDLLMNLLRIALKTNPDLKLIVMSATIDTDMFQKYFNGAPILEVPGFTYPVKFHFLNDLPNRFKLQKTEKMCNSSSPAVVCEDVVQLIRTIDENKGDGAILCFLPGWDDISKVNKLLPYSSKMAVYCLHSRLQDSEQWKIFSRPPHGVRKVILATNIAETSVTIDDVVYVIDTGIQKEQRFDTEKGVMCLDNYWISKANAIQRRGRAGRCQPGECYHLYPRHRYESFSNHSLPEILRTSLTKIVLDSKVFSSNMNAVEFMSKLPCPPENNAILCAVDELKELELLDDEENLTPLGKTLSSFQLEPKLSKAMVNAIIYKCVTPVIDIVTLFASDNELFSGGLMDKEASKRVKAGFCDGSDHLAMMNLLEKWLECADGNNRFGMEEFSHKYNLIPHKMFNLQKLRQLHFDYLYKGLYDVMAISDDLSDNNELVKAVVYSGVGTILQHRNWDMVKNRIKNNVNVLITRNNQKAILSSDSVNYKRHKYPSDFLMYINETRSNIRRTTIIRESSLISPLSVLLFSNKKLRINLISKDNYLSKISSDDQVELRLDGTNIKFICDKLQAQKIKYCKESLTEAYQYFIYQLTKGGDYNSEVNKIWDEILQCIDELLIRNSVN